MAATTTIALFSELSKQLNRENFTKCVDLCNKSKWIALVVVFLNDGGFSLHASTE